MTCMSCAERSELFMKMREAYRRGDIVEAKRFFKEAVGTALRDVEKITAVILRMPEGAMERFDFTSKKPEPPP